MNIDPLGIILTFICIKLMRPNKPLVVSIGTNPTFKVNKVPMEYVPTMSKRFQFFGLSFLVFNICHQYFVVLLRKKRVRNNLTPPSHCAGQVNS